MAQPRFSSGGLFLSTQSTTDLCNTFAVKEIVISRLNRSF